MTRTIALLAASLFAGLVVPASADQIVTQYDAMMADSIARMNQFGGQLSNYENQITQGAMNDPQIQAAYQQYQANGGYQDFATWAFNYRATGGYSPSGVANAYAVQNDNNARVHGAWNDYQGAVGNANAAIGNWNNDYADNQDIYRQNLGGNAYYTDPNGNQVPLSYMPSAEPTYDANTGYTYVPEGNGDYTAYDQNGYGYDMGW